MNKLLIAILLLALTAVAYWWFSKPMPLVSQESEEAIVFAQGLSPTAFFSNSLIGLGSQETGVSLSTLQAIQQAFEQKRDQVTGSEREKWAALAGLASFYQKKQSVKEDSVFFQQEKNLSNLCSQQQKAREIVERQRGLFLDAANLDADAIEMEPLLGKRLFSLTPSKEADTLEELQKELSALEFVCVVP